jgi:hypothetical protein
MTKGYVHLPNKVQKCWPRRMNVRWYTLWYGGSCRLYTSEEADAAQSLLTHRLILQLTFDEILYWQIFLRKITRISGPLRKSVFSGIWRKLVFVITSEENYENLEVLEGGWVHWHLKKAYFGNPFCRKSWESQGLRGRLCSLACEESLYW